MCEHNGGHLPRAPLRTPTGACVAAATAKQWRVRRRFPCERRQECARAIFEVAPSDGQFASKEFIIARSESRRQPFFRAISSVQWAPVNGVQIGGTRHDDNPPPPPPSTPPLPRQACRRLSTTRSRLLVR